MEWVLVYISLTFHGHPIAEETGRYVSMTECFYAREALAKEVGGKDGYFPLGQQAVCIMNANEEI
tara:strand:+ start:1406 stop:1600 length:195 start_codon:yes stop_codon:yes gene_type:complete